MHIFILQRDLLCFTKMGNGILLALLIYTCLSFCIPEIYRIMSFVQFRKLCDVLLRCCIFIAWYNRGFGGIERNKSKVIKWHATTSSTRSIAVKSWNMYKHGIPCRSLWTFYCESSRRVYCSSVAEYHYYHSISHSWRWRRRWMSGGSAGERKAA